MDFRVVSNIGAAYKNGSIGEFVEHSNSEGPVEIKYSGVDVRSSEDKELDPTCFMHNRVPVYGELLVSAKGDKLFFKAFDPRRQIISSGLLGTDRSFGFKSPPTASFLLNLGISSAYAQGHQPLAYEELRRDLKSDNSTVWVEARRELTDNFEYYRNNVVDEIFVSRSAAGDFLASLISALTHGIGVDIDFDPNTNIHQLDLELPLPYVDGNELRVFQLTGDDSAAVRRQARRLIQRYPVDAFEQLFEPLIDAAVVSNCSVNPEVPNAQAQIYASIFYKYNRLIHLYMETDISAEDFAVIESTATRILGAAENCLTDKSLKVDAAAILYAKWVLMIYADNSPSLSDAAVQSAKAFIGFVDANTSDNAQYYIQGHISHVKAWLENN